MNEFKFPDVGEGITEGTLIKWLVKEGDSVKEDQVLAEVETDKAVVEIPSPQAGTITKLHANANDKIKVGQVLVTFDGTTDTKESKQEAKEPESEQEEPKQEPKELETKVVKEKPKSCPIDNTSKLSKNRTKNEDKTQDTKTKSEVKTKSHRVLATPHTRKLARELNIDLSKIEGTGPGGRITDDDLKTAETTPSSKAEITSSTKPLDGRREPMSSIRKTIADKLSESKNHAVHVTHHDTADITRLVKVRESIKSNALKRGVKLTFLPFITKSTISALMLFPELNASLDESTDEIVYHDFYNVGIALDTDEGLLVPVIKGSDNKSIMQLGKEIHDLADRGRAKKLSLDDMKDSTFTITNVGSVGGTYFTPIINYPNVAILGVGRIKEEVRMKDGIPSKRHILYLSLSYDHRVVDGAKAAYFMNEIVKHLEDPDLMLVDVV